MVQQYPAVFRPLKVCRFPFYHYRLKVIGAGIYFVVYFTPTLKLVLL